MQENIYKVLVGVRDGGRKVCRGQFWGGWGVHNVLRHIGGSVVYPLGTFSPLMVLQQPVPQFGIEAEEHQVTHFSNSRPQTWSAAAGRCHWSCFEGSRDKENLTEKWKDDKHRYKYICPSKWKSKQRGPQHPCTSRSWHLPAPHTIC